MVRTGTLDIETASSVWRYARNPMCNGKRRVLMYMHRDFLESLSPSVSRVATLVGDEPAHRLDASGGRDFDDVVDEWGVQSFPASDPPSNW
jgi:hypothetical protein